MVEADRILKENNFRHLPVTDGKKLVGILSDRDVQRAMTVVFTSDKDKGQSLIQSHKKVSEYMSTPVHKMRNTDTITRMVREMVNRKVSCFIIEDEESADVGIITTEDLLILLLDLLEKEKAPAKIFKRLFRLG
jgi:acetoin utilization protein AcuB